MGSDTVLETEKKHLAPKDCNSRKGGLVGPGPGRPKGLQNKFTTNLKDAFLKVFDDLGGARGLLEWAKENRNKPQFYSMIAKMLPTNLTFEQSPDENGDKKFIIEVRHTKDEGKKNNAK